LHGLFYVSLQLLVVAAIILSFKFYCKFYCSCDPSLIEVTPSRAELVPSWVSVRGYTVVLLLANYPGQLSLVVLHR